MNILILEPYYGGSHKRWLNGLVRSVDGNFTILKLPPRKWKMRMQLAATQFIEQLKAQKSHQRRYDVVLCSSLMDTALFRARVHEIEGWNHSARILIYFHENQFVYPQQIVDKGIHQFTAINFHSACAADSVAFNSHFNRDTFFSGCKKLLKAAADTNLLYLTEVLKAKSQVIYPPLDFSIADAIENRKRHNRDPVIVWNHRWEHDKNPDDFFSTLIELKEQGQRFKLILLGQQFRYIPSSFLDAHKKLFSRIVHWGYVESYKEYLTLLKQGDIIISTARHEFFGLAVIEAVRCGCTPLLPDSLAYPEIFPEKYRYKKGELSRILGNLLRDFSPLEKQQYIHLTKPYSWEKLKPQYTGWINGQL